MVMSLGDALPPPTVTVTVTLAGDGGGDDGSGATVTVSVFESPGPLSATVPGFADTIAPAAKAGCAVSPMPIMLVTVASATNSPAYARFRGCNQDRRCAVTTSPPPPDRSSSADPFDRRCNCVVELCSNAE